MISYDMSVGYNSGYCKDNVWDVLKRGVETLCQKPFLLAEEVLKKVNCFSESSVTEYAACYKNSTDLTIEVLEDERIVRQIASGGGESRKIKECLRRAFIRLIMKKMHEFNMDINVIVT